MTKFINPLESIKIASPCSADWNAMIGNERRRHCGECRLNVYNLSGMTKIEAENLLLHSEGRVCVRYFKRADGTVLTKDCPVGWKAFKHSVSKKATAFASLFFAALSGIGLTNYFVKAEVETQTMGTIAVTTNNSRMGEPAFDGNSNTAFQGAPEAVMGNVVVPQYMEGEISNLNKVKRQILKKQNR